MHIPDGYLGPQTCIATYAVAAPIWFRAAGKVKASLPKKYLPRLALAGAFSFVVMMFNLPLPGGTTGHAVGGALIAIWLGPWAALISTSVTLSIQALVFSDGGITTLGANILTMGVIMPFSAAGIYKHLAGKSAIFNKRHQTAAFAAGYLSLTLAAIAVGALLGLQPLIASEAGRALYAPYPLSVTVPVMAGDHLIFFGPIEGMVTALALTYLAKAETGGTRFIPTAAARLKKEGA